MGLDGVEVWYTHRGAPGDIAMILATDIRELGSWSFERDAPPGRSGTIPYHRVQRIVRGNEALWERRAQES